MCPGPGVLTLFTLSPGHCKLNQLRRDGQFRIKRVELADKLEKYGHDTTPGMRGNFKTYVFLFLWNFDCFFVEIV